MTLPLEGLCLSPDGRVALPLEWLTLPVERLTLWPPEGRSKLRPAEELWWWLLPIEAELLEWLTPLPEWLGPLLWLYEEEALE